MSSFNNTSSIIETFLNRFQSELKTFKTGLDKSDLYEGKLVNMAKFEKFLAEFVKTHIDETFIEKEGRNTILTQIYGDNFNNLSDERIKIIIDAATKDEFAHIKAKIQALSDLLILTMEGGEGQIGKLFQRIDKTLHATGLSIVNSVRTYMGYAALSIPPRPVEDLTPEMSDGDIVRALLALEHDPNDHSVLYASGLTLPTDIVTEEEPNQGTDLIKEVKKIMFEKVKLREVIVEGKIPNNELQPFIVNRNKLNSELEELGNVHRSDTLEYDTAAIRNLITHFIRKTSRVTRNAVTEVKKLIDTLEAKLRNPEKTEHTIILGAIKKMKEDISKAEKYVSPAGKTFIVQRIFSKSAGLLKTFVDGPLKTFMDTLGGEGEHAARNRIIEISDELLANRETLKALLESKGLFDDIEKLGLNEDEMDELKETFITLLLTGGDTQTIVDAMPNQGQEVNNNHSLMDNESKGNNGDLDFLRVFNEEPVVVNENQKIKRAKLMPNHKNNNNNNNNASIGGKRKKTAKKNNKKSKATKKMKKIKRTMKRKTGKKAKKTSRRRR